MSEVFDRSFLSPTVHEATLLADTHHLLDAMMYAAPGDSQAPELMEDWGARSDWAFELARALGNADVFHVGDLQQEYPDSDRFEEGRTAVKSAIESTGLRVRISVGNMDIGDKPDPTMPASWVSSRTLKLWEEDYGRSFHSVRHENLHFVFLNSQIIESALPDADEQKKWFEMELAENDDARTFVFLHMPPFIVDEDEPGLGSYDAMGDEARTWFLELCRRHGIEGVFAGHTHFQIFNRVGTTRIYCLPSTTTTRPGWYEAFAVAPDDQGKADIEKLGLCVLRIHERGHAVHLIRTRGATGRSAPNGWARILTGTSQDLASSGLGAFLRMPLVALSDGAIGYPYNVRHRVRDDYPFLACIELGLQHVRFPAADLELPVQAGRLTHLRNEGVGLTALAIWDGESGLQAPSGFAGRVDVVEIQSPGQLTPGPAAQDLLASLRDEGVSVSLSPIVMEDIGLVHKRPRTAYRADEIDQVAADLAVSGLAVDRLVCGIGPDQSPSSVVLEASSEISGHAVELDFLLSLDEDSDQAVSRIIEGALASACVPGSRLFVDPLQDSDRTASVVSGLLDRLSNPRPAFHALATVNTVLFGDLEQPGYQWRENEEASALGQIWCVAGSTREVWAGSVADLAAIAEFAVGDSRAWSSTLVVDPVERLVRSIPRDARSLLDALEQCPGRRALVVSRGASG